MIKKKDSLTDYGLYTEKGIDVKKIIGDAKKASSDAAEKITSVTDPGAKGIDYVNQAHRVDSRSIVARAQKSVLQFPVYITQSLRVNEAHIIAKMFERVYATLVQSVLSQNPIINEDEVNELKFLQKFHTNLNESKVFLINEFYTPIDTIDEMMRDSKFYSESLSKNVSVDFYCVPTTDINLIKENARLMNEPLTGFSYLKEDTETRTDTKEEVRSSSSFLSNNEVEEIVKQQLIDRMHNNPRGSRWNDIDDEHKQELIDNEVQDFRSLLREDDAAKIKANAAKRLENSVGTDEWKKLPEEDRDKKINDEVAKVNNLRSKYRIDDAGRIRAVSQSVNKSTNTTTITTTKDKEMQSAVDVPVLIKDADIKKTNGMLPYSIVATFRVKAENGELTKEVSYVIGVKTVLHLIRVQDLSEDLREIITGNIKSLQKVRYKTGEITFMDYMFNISGLKKDAAKRVNYNKYWINTLKRLGEYEKLNGSYLKKPAELIRGSGVPIPNGTIVLSQTDVSMLTNQTGIDLSEISNAKRLAKTLFLIAVVIVDSSAGSMRVLFPDRDDEWDVQSLAAIDAEIAKTDNSQLMKELNRMVNH